jgi:hypothetical protein
MAGIQERLDRLESLVEAQQETIQQQRERIDELEGETDGNDTTLVANRRSALKAGGLMALSVGGVGIASANAQGQVGTSDDPLQALYTDELNGGVTGEVGLTDQTGTNLNIDESGNLTATDARIDIDDGGTTVTNVEGITFGSGLTVTDDGDGVSIDR